VIVYRLACAAEHHFEGWFASAEACEQQALAGQIRCPVCDSQSILKLPSAPYVQTSGAASPPTPPVDEARVRAMVRSEAAALVRKHLLENTEDVGRKFPEVARRIHYREEEARNIRGRATPGEAESSRVTSCRRKKKSTRKPGQTLNQAKA
jgi:hypothetical protein